MFLSMCAYVGLCISVDVACLLCILSMYAFVCLCVWYVVCASPCVHACVSVGTSMHACMCGVCPCEHVASACVFSVSVRVVSGCGSVHACSPFAVCVCGVRLCPYVGLCALGVLRVGVASPAALTLG